MSDELGVEDVRRVLEPYGLEVRELPADTSTAELAARALETEVAMIVKSLVFIADDEPILVLAPGDRTVDICRLRKIAGAESIRLAKPAEVIRLAGYRVGGVPPVGHRRALRTLLDPRLLDCSVVFAAAGASNAIFPVSPALLHAMTAAEIMEPEGPFPEERP